MNKRQWIGMLVLLLLSIGLGQANAQKAKTPPKANAHSAPLKATVTAHSVVLTWTQSTGATPACTPTPCPVTGNQILRGTATGTETLLATLTTPATTYTDSAVVAGTTYFYEITAVNVNGASGPSTEVSGTIPNQVVPNPPTNPTAIPN